MEQLPQLEYDRRNSDEVENSHNTKPQQNGRKEIVFFCQIFVLFTIIVASIINLSLDTKDPQLWVAMMSTSLGAMLPSPKLRYSKRQNIKKSGSFEITQQASLM